MTINEVIKRINPELFVDQKEWLAKQVAELEPSGTEHSSLPEGILQFMDLIQDAAEKELGICFDRTELPETREVTEWCPHCEKEITMKWNVKEEGLSAFCPNCGNVLMLCANCPVTEGDSTMSCAYDTITGACQFSEKREMAKEEPNEILVQVPFECTMRGYMPVTVTNDVKISAMIDCAQLTLKNMSDDELQNYAKPERSSVKVLLDQDIKDDNGNSIYDSAYKLGRHYIDNKGECHYE